MNVWASLSLQEGYSVVMELMISFHDYMMIILFLIMGLVSYMFCYVLTTKSLDKYVVDSHLLEFIWTIIPMAILLFMAFPSLYLLYLTEDTASSSLSVKVLGHQWYWEYEYDLFNSVVFDSYLISSMNSHALFRNLDVDNRLVLPSSATSLLLVGSADVLHSWTVPMLGVKVDAVPGRLNYLSLAPTTPGLFYGQCSELCGTNHSFMPIVVESLNPEDFLGFLMSYNS